MEVLLLEQIERRVLAERQVAAMAGMDLPDVGAAQEQFRLVLESEPEAADPEMEDLMIVFGLSR